MPASDDLLVGKIALQLKFITRPQLNDCVRIQESGTPKLPIGEILLSRGLIDDAQLKKILDLQKKNLSSVDPSHRKKREDILFGKMVIKQKLATVDQVNECLRLQASQDADERSLGQVMVKKGYLTREQVKDILEHQLKKIMRCEQCRLSFTVLSTRGGQDAKCPRCKGPLAAVKPNDTVSTHGEFATMQMRAVRVAPPSRPEARPESFSCPICDSSFDGTVDVTGRVQCQSCHTSFTPKK